MDQLNVEMMADGRLRLTKGAHVIVLSNDELAKVMFFCSVVMMEAYNKGHI
jgi:hypothetical protein